MAGYDLDAANSPDEVIRILRRFAERAFESAGELESAWQDRSAGRPWTIIGRTLDRAADSIETQLKRSGYPLRGQTRRRRAVHRTSITRRRRTRR